MDPLKDPLAKQTAAGIPLTGACDARGVPTKMSRVFGPFKDPKKGFALEMFFARRKNMVSLAASHCSNKCLSLSSPSSATAVLDRFLGPQNGP